MKTWLFFDLGSTLLDERACYEYRISDMLQQENAPNRSVIEQKMKECAAQGKMPYKDTVKELGLKLTEWPKTFGKAVSRSA